MKRCGILLIVWMCFGCGGKVPQFSAEHQPLLKRFEQQIGLKKLPAMQQVCDQVEKLHEQHKMTDEEYQALHPICTQALAGEWDRANALLKPLIAGQSRK